MRHLTLVLALALVACEGPMGPAGQDGEDGDPFPPPHIFGTYELERVNGMPLPYRYATGPTSSSYFVAGSVSLNANLSYVRSTTEMRVVGTDTTYTTTAQTGLFTNNDGDVSLVLNASTFLRGIVFRNTLTLNVVGAETWVYRR